MFRGRTQPRLEARQSHTEPGLGPLVSNPVRIPEPPPASMGGSPKAQVRQIFRPSEYQQQLEAQRVREHKPTLHPADPRAHWAGIVPSFAHLQDSTSVPVSRLSSVGSPRPRASEWSPHLHRNERSGWGRRTWCPPSTQEKGGPFFAWANMQLLLFLAGFLCPLLWFVGAALPLPPPREVLDTSVVEKREHADLPRVVDVVVDQKEESFRAHTTSEESPRRENARWWRGLNRVMSGMGVAVLVVVIVLACIYQ